MLPLLIIYKSEIELEKYLQTFITDHELSAHYVFHINPPKTEITIDQIRSVKKEVELIDTNMRLFIIHSFHTAGGEAQNAFLKTLEEKSSHNIFMLLASNEHQVLPTIKSRVKTIHLEYVIDNKEIEESAKRFITLQRESPSYQFLGDPFSVVTTKEKALLILDGLIYYFRTVLRAEPYIAEILKKVLLTKSLLISNNLNPQLAIDSLLIFIYRHYPSLANEEKRSNN